MKSMRHGVRTNKELTVTRNEFRYALPKKVDHTQFAQAIGHVEIAAVLLEKL